MTALASRIGRIERWRNESDHPRNERLILISPAISGWNEHDAGCIDPWPDGTGCNTVVASGHAADPIKGLSDCQRHWLRIGDHVDVDSLNNGWATGPNEAVFAYAFDWPCDPGPPGPLL